SPIASLRLQGLRIGKSNDHALGATGRTRQEKGHGRLSQPGARLSVLLPAKSASAMHSEANRNWSCQRRQSKLNPNEPTTNHRTAPNKALLRSCDRDDHRRMLKKAASQPTSR